MSINLTVVQLSAIDRLAASDANGNRNYPAMYAYIAEQMRSGQMAGAAPDQIYWFEQASSINGNVGTPAAIFIRSATASGLLANGRQSSLSVIQDISDAIGFAVYTDISRIKAIPDFEKQLGQDISSSLNRGGMSIGGWGGSFYYWNYAYTDQGGKVSTVGQAIMSDPAQYKMFIEGTAKALVDTQNKFGTALLYDESFWMAFAKSAQNFGTARGALVISEINRRVAELAIAEVGADAANTLGAMARRMSGFVAYIPFSDASHITTPSSLVEIAINKLEEFTPGGGSIEWDALITQRAESFLAGRNLKQASVEWIKAGDGNATASEVFIRLANGESIAMTKHGIATVSHLTDDNGNSLVTSTHFDGSYLSVLSDASGARDIRTFTADNAMLGRTHVVADNGVKTTQNFDSYNQLIDTVKLSALAGGGVVSTTTYPNGNEISVLQNQAGQTQQTTRTTIDPNGNEHIVTTNAAGQQTGTKDIQYFYDENGRSRLETQQTANGTIREAFGTDGALVRTDRIPPLDIKPGLPASTYADVASLISALRSGKPIPILASGARLANDFSIASGNGELGGLNAVTGGVLAFYNLYNAFQGNDKFAQVNASLSAINYANLALVNTAVYSKGLNTFFNGGGVANSAAGSAPGVLPVIGVVLAIKNEDPVGLAMSLGVLVQGSAFLATPLGIGLVTIAIAQIFLQKGPPDAWGVASVHFGPGITNYGSVITAQGDNFGPERARGQLQSVMGLFAGLIAQNNTAADSNTHIGLVPQRMPSVTYRASEFGADAGYRVVDIDPLTGAQRAPELRFDDQGQLFGVRPDQLSEQTRSMLRLDGSPGTPALTAYLINTALAREALAPLWQVQTARMQEEANDPNAGLSEEERAAKAGLAAALDAAYAQSHRSDPQAANRRLGHFMAVGVDLDGDGRIATHTMAENLAAGHAITRDWDQQGYQKNTGWIGAGDGFLVIDQNLNGSIDGAREMLSNPLVADAAKGLRSLAAFDANGDGRIDARDPIYAHLKVWQDLDQDGDNTRAVTVGGRQFQAQDETAGQLEMRGLAELGISAIDYGNSRFERVGGANVTYGALSTVTLEAAQEGLRYTPAGSGIEVKASDGDPVIVVTRVESEAAVYRGLQIGVAGETIGLFEDGRAAGYNPLTEGGQIPILIASASLLANDTWGGAAGAASGLAITGVRMAAHGSATLLADGSIRLLLEANYHGTAELFYTVALPGSEAVVQAAEARVLLDITAVNDAPTVANTPDAARRVYGYTVVPFDIVPYDPDTQWPNVHYVGLGGGTPVYAPYVEHIAPQPIYGVRNQDSNFPELLGYSPEQITARLSPITTEATNTGRVVATSVDGGNFGFQILGQPLYGSATIDAAGNWAYVGRRPGFIEVGDINRDGAIDLASALTGEVFLEYASRTPRTNIESNMHVAGETSFQDFFTVRVFDNSDASRQTFRDVSVAATHFGPTPVPEIASSGGKPIAIDLDGDGFHFVDVDDSKVFMDVNGDGWRRRMAWTSPGDGLLAYDRDGDGRVERFDEIGFVPYAPDQPTDMAALRKAFDTNGNGLLDAGDQAWRSFGVWQDANANGLTDAGEFKSLGALGITSIGLDSDGRFEVIDGQSVHGHTTATRADGSTLAVADVTLRYSNQTQVLQPGANGGPAAETVVAVPAFGTPLNIVGTAGKDLALGSRASDRFAMGDGDDTVIDDGGNDLVEGGAGDDQIYTGIDNDFIQAGAGADAVFAGAGNDIAFGDDGNDVLMMEAGNDVAFGGAGDDFISGGAGNDVLSGNDGRDSLFGEDGWDVLFGQDGDDELRGMDGNDVLYGGAGQDLLSGGAGDDLMEGGAGDDRYEVDSAGDQVVELVGEGTDTVVASIGYTLAAELENLELVGTDALAGTGNTRGNQLTGNDGANVLYGLDGDDVLDGGAGADRLVGGAGNDRYRVDNTGDQVLEEAGGGVDTVESRVGFTLSGQVENLTLVGTADIDGTGNALDNILVGNVGDNQLRGGDGADRLSGGKGQDLLSGGAGDDWMAGGLGDDVYEVDSAGDVVSEQAGEGFDMVRATVSFTLGAELENLQLIGGRAVSGTGNGLANRLIGNDLANTLYGMAGNDVLEGGAGNDTLDGGTGADTLVGGTGDDAYGVDNIGDTVVEDPAAGIDRIDSAVSFSLSANVENLTLTGTGAIDGTGNELDNLLVGNAANNRLFGGAGQDVLRGGRGDDRLEGGAGDDRYFYAAGDGLDTLEDASGVDSVNFDAGLAYDKVVLHLRSVGGRWVAQVRIRDASGRELAGQGIDYAMVTDARGGISSPIESFVFADGSRYEWTDLLGGAERVGSGLAGDVQTGGRGRDVIYGGWGPDLLFGGAGDDWMSGEYGNDTLYGGSGNDTLYGGWGDDALYGEGGDDQLSGEYGDDLLVDLAGNNRFDGGFGNDVLRAGAGNDLMDSGYGDDTVLAGDGTNRVSAGFGNDYVLTGTGADWIDAGGGVDVVQAQGGDDTVYGGYDNDLISGGAGADRIWGDEGDDWIAGNAGDDTIDTGYGRNLIAFNRGDGRDTVLGGHWSTDILSLGAGIRYADLRMAKSGNDLLLETGGSDSVRLKDWYSGLAFHGVSQLQLVTVGGDYDAASGDPTKNRKVEVFDFERLARQFDTARAANTGAAQGWAVMDKRVDAWLRSSDSAAMGGDMAFQFATTGGLTGIDLGAAQFASAAGTGFNLLHSRASLETGTAGRVG